MYLKALKLHGFKSFADPTDLRFEPGVTAIVGPNGCGKSNIADAIRWVLGEQSAKALRGGKMHDVIFEGTDTRKPHSLCEVSLLLTECEAQLGTEFHEVEIARRVSRDGQSEYFLNGASCRLKDIQKLFMDTGVGRTSYSIMAQGQIDQILSSKPEERRAVFEEAAGITRYKSQRREALGKLALVEQNLARVADVIGELGRQIGTLRRQAAKAMRFRRLNHRLRHLSVAHDAFHFAALQRVVGELAARLDGLRAEAEVRRARLAEHQQNLEAKRLRRSELNQRVQAAQQAVFDLRSACDQAANQAHIAQVKRQALIERLEGARHDLAELEMQLKEVSDQADTGQQDKQLQLNLLGQSDAEFQSKNRDVALAEGELTKAEQQLQKEKFHLLELESRVARLRTDRSGLEVDQKTAAARHAQLVAEVEQARAQHTAAVAHLEALRTATGQAREAQAAAQQAVAAAQEEVRAATGRFREGQRVLQEIDRALAQKTARLRLLQQLQEKWEGFGEGAKALLSGRMVELNGGAPFVSLAQGAEFVPEWAKAAEALLAGAAEAVTVADIGAAQAILARLEQDRVGTAYLKLPVAPPSVAADRAEARRPEWLQPAEVVVARAAAEHPLRAVLAGCYVADTLERFLGWWREHPDFSFLLVATARGEWVDRRGLVFGGYQKKPATSIVQRDIELRATQREVDREQQAHHRQKTEVDRLTAELAAAEEALGRQRTAVQSAAEAHAQAQAEERAAQRAVDDAQQRVARFERELAQTEAAQREADARLAKAAAALAEVETQIVRLRDAIAAGETRVGQLRADRDAKREMLAAARLELAERRQKVELLDRGLGEMLRRRAQLAELLAQRRSELELWAEQVAELAARETAEARKGEELARTLAVAQESVEQVRAQLVALEREVGTIESELDAVRGQADTAASELNRCEVQLTENRARARFMAEEAQREFQVDLDAVDWRRELWRADDEPEGLRPLDLDEDDDDTAAAPTAEGAVADREPAKPRRGRKPKAPRGEPTDADLAALEATDWTAVRAEVAALRQRLQSMGAVNLVAIEEYAELRQRFDFLTAQSNDLIASKRQLVQAIDEINQTSLRQFETTFEQIRKNFAFTFQQLFGGGVAELHLIAAEDILESGIEIVAQPPGTKLKSITLLSGGQKTLTAVALLFALYLVKPSPFCLLDELDAPLDESNIGRFTGLLKQFTENSQFIIITHNKRTIAAADAIYGVTMEERGVSKTVSMKFHAEHHADPGNLTPVADAVRNARAAVAASAVAAPPV